MKLVCYFCGQSRCIYWDKFIALSEAFYGTKPSIEEDFITPVIHHFSAKINGYLECYEEEILLFKVATSRDEEENYFSPVFICNKSLLVHEVNNIWTDLYCACKVDFVKMVSSLEEHSIKIDIDSVDLDAM